jgi:hypothetical protein
MYFRTHPAPRTTSRPLLQLAMATLVIASLFAGTSAQARWITIDTAPVTGGRVFVNDRYLGEAPVELDVQFREGQSLVARAEKPGAMNLRPIRFDRNSGSRLVLPLEKDVVKQTTEASDQVNAWLTIRPQRPVNDERREEVVWRKLLSLVTDGFTELDQIDRSGFFIRTQWRVSKFELQHVRCRLVVKMAPTDEFALRVMLETESALKTPGAQIGEESFAPISRLSRRDQELLAALHRQL